MMAEQNSVPKAIPMMAEHDHFDDGWEWWVTDGRQTLIAKPHEDKAEARAAVKRIRAAAETPTKKVIEPGEPDDLMEVSRGRGQTST